MRDGRVCALAERLTRPKFLDRGSHVRAHLHTRVQIERDCVAEGRLMYEHAAHDLGCRDFMMAQNAACECPHDEL